MTRRASSGREPMAPFAVAIAPIGYDRSEAVRAAADRLHDELRGGGIEVLLDDRGERPGVMFADLELIGIPHRITSANAVSAQACSISASQRSGKSFAHAHRADRRAQALIPISCCA